MAFNKTNFPGHALILFFSAWLITSCSKPDNQAELKKLAWLQGTWSNEANGQKTTETWKKQHDNSYLVHGWLLEGTDTIFSESIQVKPAGKKVVYLVTIPDQHNGEPVAFTLTENTGKSAAFTNPENDFPNQIHYAQTSANKVLVQLKGTLKGKPVDEKYTLHKETEPEK